MLPTSKVPVERVAFGPRVEVAFQKLHDTEKIAMRRNGYSRASGGWMNWNKSEGPEAIVLQPFGAASTYSSRRLTKVASAQALDHFDVTVDGILIAARPSGAIRAWIAGLPPRSPVVAACPNRATGDPSPASDGGGEPGRAA